MKTQYRFLWLTALTLNCTESSCQPVITSQPKSQTVILYQPAAFGVIASGTAPLGYQWRKDGVPIAGATNDQIVLAHPLLSDSGLYSVVVSDAEGSLTSSDVALTVNPPKGGDLDYSFAWGGSIGFVDNSVVSVAVQRNRKVLIARQFWRLGTADGVTRAAIARLNADGTPDYTFMKGFTGSSSGAESIVNSVAVQSDGKVLVVGYFTTFNGVSRNGIARLNADGTLDTGFQAGLSEDNVSVYSAAVRSDGKVLIGGSFTKVNGLSRTNIALLDVDGSLDTNFQNGLSGLEGRVGPLALQSDDKALVLIVGGFNTVNGVWRSRIVRLNTDGTLDSDFQTELSSVGCCPAQVASQAVQSDGKVVIGGHFASVNGVSRTNIARLNADGTLDSGFQPGLSGANNTVSLVAVQGDGKVLIGGYPTIARLNADGTPDGSFQKVELAAFNGSGELYSVAVQSDGKLLIAGWFTAVNGVNRDRIARLNADGTLDSEFNALENEPSGADRPVTSVAVQNDGKVLIGGEFTTVNGMSRDNIARLNADGTLDSGFQNEFSGVRINVRSVAVQSDGKVFVGGQFISENEFSNSIARLNRDGTPDSSFQRSRFELGGAGDILSFAVQSDGKVLVGGQFSTVNGLGRNSIARLNADGTLDGGFQSGLLFGEIVRWVASLQDGKVLIGGEFGLVRLNSDGTLDSSFQPRVNGTVRSIVVRSDGKMLIGGDFAEVSDDSRNSIARLNADGTLDSGFQTQLSAEAACCGRVNSVAVQSDGKVLIGGTFDTVNGVSRTNLARLHVDGSLDNGFLNGLSGVCCGRAFDSPTAVYSVAVQGDGKVLVAGRFTAVNGVPAAYIARLWGNQPAYIESVSRPNGGSTTLTLRLAPGSTNRVQYKTDLSDTAWIDLPGDVIVSGSDSLTNKVDATIGAAQRRFYRVRQLP